MAEGFIELQDLDAPEALVELNRMIRELYNTSAGDNETVRIYSGFGTPENNVVAGIGSLYLRKDGGTGTTIYKKESGIGATGWVAIAAPISADATVKAWINFDGTSGDFGTATRDSFNVSSITDGGTGEYTITWDTDFANGDYAVTGACRREAGSGIWGLVALVFATTSVVVEIFDGESIADSSIVSILAIGDQ